MKKNIVLTFLSAVMVMAACNKVSYTSSNGPLPENYAKVDNSSSKEDGTPIEITYTVGHTASDCNNSCIVLNGVPTHADCQGRGNACKVTIVIWPIGGQPKGPTFNAVVDTVWDLTLEDFFLMPARSLTVIGANPDTTMYLNIPGQLLFRDTTTQRFTFTGLFYSSTPEYSND